MEKIAYLFLNGELLGDIEFFKEYIERNPGDFFCADGGMEHCKNLNLIPNEIWGDMDSVDPEELERMELSGAILKKFSKDKDYTDGELIFDYLSSKDYDKIFVIGGLGGEKAHELANINLLLKYQKAIFLTERELIFSLWENTEIKQSPGCEISFLSLTDIVEDLSLHGFKYPLANYNLKKYETRCLSNVSSEGKVKVIFKSGIILTVIKIPKSKKKIDWIENLRYNSLKI